MLKSLLLVLSRMGRVRKEHMSSDSAVWRQSLRWGWGVFDIRPQTFDGCTEGKHAENWCLGPLKERLKRKQVSYTCSSEEDPGQTPNLLVSVCISLDTGNSENCSLCPFWSNCFCFVCPALSVCWKHISGRGWTNFLHLSLDKKNKISSWCHRWTVCSWFSLHFLLRLEFFLLSNIITQDA